MNYVSGEYERAHYFQIEHTSFSCNHAHEFGGSLFLFGVSDSWIDHSIFENNSAIESGGAIGFYECDGMFLFSCTFISNACCDRQFFKNELLYDKTNHVFNKKIHAKGGGAIVVCNTEISRNNLEQKPDYRTTVIFATERCFFINNNCERQSSKEAFTKGFDIRFKGEITFQSYEDRFVNEQSLSIVGYNNETFHRHQTLFYNPNIDRDWDNFTNESNINFYQFTDKIEPMKNVFINYNINDYSWNPTSAFTENVPIIHDNVDDIITEDNELPDLPTNNFQTKLPERTTKSYAPDKTLIPSELKVPSYSRTIALIPGLYVDDDSDDSSNKNKISTGTIIGIAVGAAALLVIIVLIIFYALRKAYTMHSSIEMDPENATMETSTGSAMTENNPLYQKGNDDPFREDFTEEVHHELKKK
ncbi:hypothetical protein TRFO_33161 [Tritrichomonas foetus]|uniref:Right handed beta helix domain-containing protein n=1 Tax=Tritrichomonas foetus TaxID=1144522 RepID=A0A1J4JMC0_9EUKA|nr:hypothetical protein TRFO_33161 [Tritrichomonas foetus]|eukprot:OHT00211.1 hypothetical protein TRFO_33161 [Tritrichomonas foetus]